MGILNDALSALAVRGTSSSKATSAATTVPIWDAGREQMPPTSYERNARDGYMLDELVYACILFKATSAGEPPVCAYRGEDKLDSHPSLDILNNPNPYMGRSRFWAAIQTSKDISGNAYVEKVRSNSGKLVELWPLRGDRVRVIPGGGTEYIAGYTYTIGATTIRLPAEDVIHFKYYHPLDDYYGLAPLSVLAGRVDLDIWTRRFTESFFRNAGVPAGLLNIVRTLSETDRQSIRRNFREMYGGSENWHKLLVIDNGQATYEQMATPMNQLAMPELIQINEARICAAFGVPASIAGTVVGAEANRGQTAAVSDRALFWESTMVPNFRDDDSTLTAALKDEYPDVDHWEHDLGSIKALQEDQSQLHERWRATWESGAITWPEYRMKLGLSPEPDEPGIVLVPSNMTMTWSPEMLKEPEPEPVMPALPAGPGDPNAPPMPANQNGHAPMPAAANGTNGRNGAARY